VFVRCGRDCGLMPSYPSIGDRPSIRVEPASQWSPPRTRSQQAGSAGASRDTRHGVTQVSRPVTTSKRAITSKIKRAIKLKTSPARLAQLLQPSLAFCFSLQPMTAYRPFLDGTPSLAANDGCNSCATVVQVLQDLFYVLLHVLVYL